MEIPDIETVVERSGECDPREYSSGQESEEIVRYMKLWSAPNEVDR